MTKWQLDSDFTPVGFDPDLQFCRQTLLNHEMENRERRKREMLTTG
jgi:hypothetical protein